MWIISVTQKSYEGQLSVCFKDQYANDLTNNYINKYVMDIGLKGSITAFNHL